MLFLRLLDKNINHSLELLTNDPVPLTYNFRDVSTLSAKGNHSQTFRIPASPHNEEYFKGFFDVNYEGSINPKRKVGAVILEDTIPLMHGHIQIKRVIIQNDKPEYEIVFFGETVDFWGELGKELLSDMDWSAYDHENNNTNISAASLGGLFSGDIRYGIIDRSHNWSANGENGTSDFATEWTTGAFTPFMKAKVILDAIFEDTTFTYASTFLNTSAFTDCFMPLFSGNQLPITTSSPQLSKFNVGLTSTENPGVGLSLLYNLSDSGNFFDAGGNYTINTGTVADYYTPPNLAVYTIRYWATTEVESGYPSGTEYAFQFGVRDDLGNWVHSWNVNHAYPHHLSQEIEVTLDPARTYRLAVHCDANDSHGQFLGGSTPDTLGGTGWEVTDVSYPLGSGTIDTAANFPKMTKVDFVKSLVDMFNLVMIADKNNPKKVLIEPYNDYQGSGDTLDWTKKLDLSKDYSHAPTSDIQKRKYSFSYTDGSDYINKYIQDTNLRTYGRFLIDDTENDFSTGELKIKSKFTAYPITPISGTNIIAHKAFDASLNKLKEAKPHLVYNCGLVTCDTIHCLDPVALTYTDYTQYNHFSHFNEYEPDTADLDLNYGQDVTFYPVDSNPYGTLYNSYWRDAINQLYSPSSRVFEGWFNLDAVDIQSFKFSDKVFIRDSYWRIEKIDGYKANEGSTKVKLIKILDSSVDCEYTPIGTNSTDLSIIFEDSAGATSVGNQTCCELYGYTWDGSACFNSVNPGLPAPSYVGSHSGSTARNSQRGATGFMQGVNNINPESSAFNNINAINATITDYVTASMVAGRGHNVGDDRGLHGLLVTGQNVNAFEAGRHFGGRNDSDDLQGAIQTGEILMHVADTGWASTTSKNLLLDGSYLNMPDETMWSVQAHIVVEEWVGATPAFADYKTIMANANWYKDRAAAKAGAWTIQSQTGTLGTFALATDVATDTTQHRLQLTYNGTTVTNPIKVTCRLTYVQTVE